MKIVVNRCYGGFGLSEAAIRLLDERLPNHKSQWSIERTDPVLVQIVEELGSKAAGGRFSELEVVEIPDGVQWEMDDYDGIETIHEVHRSW